MKGMPVAMTDHMDRIINKTIVRGHVAHVHAWVFADEEANAFEHGKRIWTRMPTVVDVKLHDKHGRDLVWT